MFVLRSRKFGFTKIGKHAKAKAKQQLLLSILNLRKWRLAILTVSISNRSEFFIGRKTIDLGKELFGREIRVTLCPRRMYNMQKQNTPFNPGAAPASTTTPISAMIKTTTSNGSGTTMSNPSTTNNTTLSTTTTTTTPATSASASGNSSTTTTTTAVTTTTSSSNTVTAANPIATISSSTLGLPRQLNHSLFKIRQTPEQQRGLLPTPPINLWVDPRVEFISSLFNWFLVEVRWWVVDFNAMAFGRNCLA